ncbi:ABC transporter substrate-binding protein [Aeromicrobium ginsengisoli]|uniref:ABC transporter substrate-binding protein n=1 Tax=Aeromicrobium ginsengisoli TaxID=363867 RepID=A0A5M4F935_9ACTN|nr:ABC transporter substrate-binding protein [Aeromicrobium ginsengisoli]KAA1394218.1 ABC transporter substrate-binding protein [Aeromicrobium ginsengisoli]
MRSRTISFASRFAVLGVSGMLALAACGGNDNNSDDASSDVKFTGEPVTVMTIAPVDTAAINQPEIMEAAKASAKALNAAGGLGGHEVKVITCNDGNDPNTAAACARQAVSKKAIAVVGGFTTSGASIVPIIAKAGIPWIGPPGFSADELASKDSYPLIAGSVAFAGLGQRAAKDGCKTIATVLYDVPTAVSAATLIANGVKAGGGAKPTDIKVPTTTTDFASVAKQIGEVDCAILGLPNDQIVATAVAGKSVGVKSRYYLVAGALNDTTIKGAQGSLDGAVTAVNFVPATEDVWKEAKDSSDKVDWTGAYNQSTWASYQVLKTVLDDQAEVTAESVVAGLAKTTNVDAGGLMAPTDFTKEFAVPGLNRVFNRQVVYLTAKDGTPVQEGDFEDLSPLFGG